MGALEQGFGVDLGSQEEQFEDTLPLGFTQIGPTVEAKGALGRWASSVKVFPSASLLVT